MPDFPRKICGYSGGRRGDDVSVAAVSDRRSTLSAVRDRRYKLKILLLVLFPV
jgi:hypothetical protein